MDDDLAGRVERAEVVLPCTDLGKSVRFFTERLGFRLDTIRPADDPRVARLHGHGLGLRLERDAPGSPGVLRLLCRDAAAAGELVAPNGTRIVLAPARPPLEIPPLRPAFSLCRAGDDARWVVGRAGMLYRDLVPDRQGGRFIASHVRIPEGGPVPDQVHHHEVRFQLIHCRRGWVRVVYEDQGPPFRLLPGDCVVQPPGIRHRVLEASPGLEVVELCCPAEHPTHVDHELELPTSRSRPERRFGGQRFVRHRAATANWGPWRLPGFEARDAGVAEATDGVAAVHVVRPAATAPASAPLPVPDRVEAELLFAFVLEGSLRLACEGRSAETLFAGDAVVVPAALAHAFAEPSRDLELLEVVLPAAAL